MFAFDLSAVIPKHGLVDCESDTGILWFEADRTTEHLVAIATIATCQLSPTKTLTNYAHYLHMKDRQKCICHSYFRKSGSLENN